MLGILASYSIAAQELKAVLALLEARNSVWVSSQTDTAFWKTVYG